MRLANKDLIQSYLITSARYDFNVHEKRIVYRLVEMCQVQLSGQKLDGNFRMDKTLFGDYVCEMPVSAFLVHDEDKNHEAVKIALRRLRNKTVEIDNSTEWKIIGVIEKPRFVKRGYVRFEIQPEIFDAILNFAKGFRKFELKTAFEFETVYAMRFYELLSGKTDPITYSVTDLKIMFRLEDRYKLTTDFIRRVIEPAKKELDAKAPFSFEFTRVKHGKKVTAFTFHPYLIPTNQDEDLETQRLQKQLALSWSLDKIYVDYLEQNYYFDKAEIKRHVELFKEAAARLDFMNFLASKRRGAETKKNPKGWLINAIKSELKKLLA